MELHSELHSLVEASIANTLDSLWPAFAPELILCISILGLLLVRLFPFGKLLDPGYLTILGAALALYYGSPWTYLEEPSLLQAREIFGGMLVYDTFTVYVRAILLFFTILFVVFTKFSGLPAREDGTDFYCLILGAVLGFCFLAKFSFQPALSDLCWIGLFRHRRSPFQKRFWPLFTVHTGFNLGIFHCNRGVHVSQYE